MQIGSFLTTLVLVIHVLAAVFWAGSTFVIARSGPPDRSLRATQAGSGAVTIVLGVWLWGIFHHHAFGTSERVLAGVAVCSVLALVVQQAIAWPARSSARANNSRAVRSERLAALLLVLATTGVVVSQYV